MSFKILDELATPEEIVEEYPMPASLAKLKEQRDREIGYVLTGRDDRFLVIIGPCSADNEDAVCEYTEKLARINERVKDRILLIPRVYTNKPRTTGSGYKGIASQPDPESKPDMRAGLIAMRKMHIHSVAVSGLTSADEMLYPGNWDYVKDILSYVAIGARSVEDQQHRLTVSGFDVPAGMKNPTSGDFTVLMNSVYAAQHSHIFTHRNHAVESSGNHLAHVVLRGSTNSYGRNFPNYHYEDIMHLYELYQQMDLVNPACVVDTNHSNSNKQYKQQIRIAKEVLHNRQISSENRSLVKGLMIESYLVEGSQKIGDGVYGKSITDPCLGWEDTEYLLDYIAEHC